MFKRVVKQKLAGCCGVSCCFAVLVIPLGLLRPSVGDVFFCLGFWIFCFFLKKNEDVTGYIPYISLLNIPSILCVWVVLVGFPGIYTF